MRRFDFRERLEREFAARRASNPKYSLRAFAAFLGTDHATLSHILRRQRRVPQGRVRVWAKRLRMPDEEAAIFVAVERGPDQDATAAGEQLRQWAAEMLGLLTEPAHWEILRLVSTPGFRADSRWLAQHIGVSVDDVNVAVHRLLRLRLLQLTAPDKWEDLTGLRVVTRKSFRKFALDRLSKLAAD